MKLFLKFIGFLFCSAFLNNVAAEANCVERAKKVSVNITECCEFPDFFDIKILNETYKKIEAEGKAAPGTPLFDCLIEQTLFKNLKFIDDKGMLDVTKMNSTLAVWCKDEMWKNIVMNSVPKCINESQKYADKYQAETGISKEICDFKYDAIADCIDINTFVHCPESSWINSRPNPNATVVAACEYVKSFIKDCYADVSAVDNFLDNQRD